MNASVQAEITGQKAKNSEWIDHAVRVGLVSYGVVHLILAYLALRLAFGDSGGNASSQGALQTLAQNTAGRVTLYVVALGFVALVVWQVIEVIWGHRRDDGTKRLLKRLGSAGKAVVYGALAASSVKTAAGASSGGENTDGITARLMRLPAGPMLVAAVGVVILVIGGVLVYRGLSESFRDDLQMQGQTGNDGTAYVLFGKIGYVSKGIAIGLVGVLFGYAALTHDPQKSGGLDQALRKLLDQPFGAPVLVVIALGLGCFGLFCFAWARHLDR
jgi:hypothetical protein